MTLAANQISEFEQELRERCGAGLAELMKVSGWGDDDSFMFTTYGRRILHLKRILAEMRGRSDEISASRQKLSYEKRYRRFLKLVGKSWADEPGVTSIRRDVRMTLYPYDAKGNHTELYGAALRRLYRWERAAPWQRMGMSTKDLVMRQKLPCFKCDHGRFVRKFEMSHHRAAERVERRWDEVYLAYQRLYHLHVEEFEALQERLRPIAASVKPARDMTVKKSERELFGLLNGGGQLCKALSQ